MGASRKIGVLLISRKVSHLGYMLLHKLYINLAIAVIFTLFSSLSDLSMKIYPIQRGPPRTLRNDNLLLAQILKNKRLKVYMLLIICTNIDSAVVFRYISPHYDHPIVSKIGRKFAAFCRSHCNNFSSAVKCGICITRVSHPQRLSDIP